MQTAYRFVSKAERMRVCRLLSTLKIEWSHTHGNKFMSVGPDKVEGLFKGDGENWFHKCMAARKEINTLKSIIKQKRLL